MKNKNQLVESFLFIFIFWDANVTKLASESAPSLVLRQICSSATGTSGRISPDGRFFTLTDGDTGELSLRDLATGSTRKLTNETSQLSIGYALESVVSPDGKQVAYISVNRDGDVELRTISLTGAPSRVLLQGAMKGHLISLKDWSPDGELIALATFAPKNKESRLVLVSSVDGKVVTFKSDSRLVSSARFSPDSRFIACTCQSFAESQQRDILLFNVSNGTATPLVDHPADDFVLGWTPRGSSLLFGSDRRGITDLWSIEVQGTKAKGESQLLKANLGQVSPMGMTRSGALLFKVPVQSSDYYMATVDFETGKIAGRPQPLPLRFNGRMRNNNISLDGRNFAFVSQRAAADMDGSGAQKVSLHVFNLISRVQRDFDSVSRYFACHGPVWLSDNKTLVFHGLRNDSDEEIAVVDIQTGELTPIAKDETNVKIEYLGGASKTQEFLAEMSDEGVYYLRKHEEGKRFVLVRHDLKNSKKTEYEILKDASQRGRYHFALNADQRSVFCESNVFENPENHIWTSWLHYFENNTIIEIRQSKTPTVLRRSPNPNLFALMEIGTNGQESVVKFFGLEAGQLLEKTSHVLPKKADLWWWTPNARFLLFLKKASEKEDSPVELWSISAQTGNVRKTELSMPGMKLVNIHPDGKQILFRSRELDREEVWMMENFLPVE